MILLGAVCLRRVMAIMMEASSRSVPMTYNGAIRFRLVLARYGASAGQVTPEAGKNPRRRILED
jgi:hypothetical protein